MTRTQFIILDALVFQGLWWSAALLRDQALVVMLVLLLVRHYLSPQPYLERVLMITLAPLSWLLTDGVLVWLKLVHFNSTQTLPLWMLLLWVGLVWSLIGSLNWLLYCTRWTLAGLGAMAGALSYYAAAQLGALSITHPLVWIMLIWAITLPILISGLQVLMRISHYDRQ